MTDTHAKQANELLHFSSDYMEGAHPTILNALVRTNMESTSGYGTDPYCAHAARAILDACACPHGEVRFLLGGTQTNTLVIDALLAPWQGVISAATGHVNVHEAGSIEAGGHKVISLEHNRGKISAAAIKKTIEAWEQDDNREHMVQPALVYLSQPTEYGTLYSKAELESIADICTSHKVKLFVDGARLAYALAAPQNDVSLADLARLTDVFYIGGTKCGLLFGEAVVFTKKNMVPGLTPLIKQHGGLLAKGRLLGVQFGELFTHNLYEQIGKTALICAARIKERLIQKGFDLYIDSPTNQVFFIATDAQLAWLKHRVAYGFMERLDARRSVVRFATCWSTTQEDTDKLLDVIDQMAELEELEELELSDTK
ncbi:MAG: aminotransferase class I/II-fold pyridoxal phosphate-dependent enzyme [Atopobium sp.]|uniref:threonine aldolase family protein n=1 Tax=Atopobium sp. TaxID=1872650 RepID=UPI002A7633F5|nr:aminotransferase class I/II-fold pyridoxal phosphate-dependent enzyme [Atopobium sp.]MDY2788619.1 aminotransferase class I/II-fold pyridoxal phosphate-dependent enzyme [Atopobium sp.]MDY4521973.1 aminotransferase class I/II-fold pyridoxal phosphate-dependent enzyme [Atopobium sp.]